jgi:flagellar motor switch protein FliG
MGKAKPQNSLAKINSEPGITKAQKAAIVLASLSAETATAIRATPTIKMATRSPTI